MTDFDWFKNYTKCFPCNGNDITIMDTPENFYNTLKEKINEANARIVWSSLYIGTGEKEKELIEALLHRCQGHKVNKNHAFEVLILLDYLRGSRAVKNVDGISALTISDSFKAGSSLSPGAEAGRSRRSAADIILPADYTSSREMVLPLLKLHSEHVNVYLYRSPKFSTLKRFLLSGSVREITGLNHVKAYIFDDDIIISGANLSQTYFTDRQDRYMLIRNNKHLCDHIHTFIKLLCRASYCLLPDDTTTLLPRPPDVKVEARPSNPATCFMSRAALGHAIGEHFDGLLHRIRAQKAKARARANRYPKDEIWEKRCRALPFLPTKRVPYESLGSNGMLQESTKLCAEKGLNEEASYASPSTSSSNDLNMNDFDTLIYPLVQAGPHGVYSDNEATSELLTKIQPGSRLWLGTGYFNMVPSYADILLNKCHSKTPHALDPNPLSPCSMRKKTKPPTLPSRPLYSTNLILASPQANGFFGETGFKKYIPLIYSYAATLFYNKIHLPLTSDIDDHHGVLYKFLRKLLERCHICEPCMSYKPDKDYAFRPEDTNPNKITMWEYARNAWTYHAKGLWLYPPLDRYPNLTFVGSSNFGYRSVFRDVELQLAVVTSNSNLREQLQNELDELLKYSTEVTEATCLAENRRVPLWLKFLYRFIKSYF